MKTYVREIKVTYIIMDEVKADSYEEAEALPVIQELPKGAITQRPVAIIQ